MVAVGFPVSGHVHQLCRVAFWIEPAEQASGKILSAGEQPFKGDGGGQRSVIKKQTNESAPGQVASVRPSRVDSILEVDPH